jgi:hypothetical protein
MKNRIAAVIAASLLGLTFSATASFAADPTDAPTDVVVDPVVTDVPTDVVVDPTVDPAATDALGTDQAISGDAAPEAIRAVTLGAPMAAQTPAPEPVANVGTAAAIAAFLAGALFFTRRRTN